MGVYGGIRYSLIRHGKYGKAEFVFGEDLKLAGSSPLWKITGLVWSISSFKIAILGVRGGYIYPMFSHSNFFMVGDIVPLSHRILIECLLLMVKFPMFRHTQSCIIFSWLMLLISRYISLFISLYNSISPLQSLYPMNPHELPILKWHGVINQYVNQTRGLPTEIVAMVGLPARGKSFISRKVVSLGLDDLPRYQWEDDQGIFFIDHQGKSSVWSLINGLMMA
jgi:hypothetical protein